MLNLYVRHGRFPSGQAELYSEGCRLLCEETNESRRAAQLAGVLSSQQRLALASRLAALTIFANRYAIWTSVDVGDVNPEDITVSALCGGKETLLDGQEIEVTEIAIREVLDTGLFSSRGTNRMGWAHQTYAEFLAGRYLAQRKMTLAQIMSLIVHPDDADNKLVPQLYETAAWLAGMMPQVFREIMKTDPEVLLRSDVATADIKDRAALVETLLSQYDEQRLLDWDFGIRKRYDKLAHPKLPEQLDPFIRDKTKGDIVRRVAVDIAEACELRELLPVLANLALDPSDSLPARVNAAHAVLRIGDDVTKATLKSLTNNAAEDVDDELKGCGFQAVWPSGMDAKELFALLTPPKRGNFVGVYHMFIVRDLSNNLQPSNIPEALLWVAAQGSRHTMPYPFRKLVDAIIKKGWEYLDSPGVLQAFAKAAFSRINHHEGFAEDEDASAIDTRLTDSIAKRHRLVETMVTMIDSEEKASKIAFCRPPIVLSQDLPWMIDRLHSSSEETTKGIWSHIISRSFDRLDPRHIDAVLVASDIETALANEMAWFFKPVELGSPEAQKMKADYLERQKWETDDHKRPILDPPPAKRIEKLLDDYESGDLSAWWRLNLAMTLKPTSTHYDPYREIEPDMTVLPGWEASTPETKQRIIATAKTYLLKHTPETGRWLGTNTIYRPDFAGYKAFRLLLHEEPSFVYNLSAESWKKWAPIILGYPCENAEAHQELVKLAYSFAPDEIIETLSNVIDHENKERGHVSITDKVQACWDKRLGDLLLSKVKQMNLTLESLRVVLKDLIEHEVQEAESLAKSLIPIPLPSAGDQRAKAIVSAEVLVRRAKDAGWGVVWPAMQTDPEFAREIATSIAAREGWGGQGGIWQKINEDSLAELFIWLTHKYPYSEDPDRDGGGRVTERESIAHWRDAILQNLKVKGTRQACDAIRRISQEFPDLHWLKWTIMEAENHARRHTWVPLKPSVILTLTANQELRLVQSGDQLLEVVIDSLKRIEAKLQGETPIAQFLWGGTKTSPRPRDEGSFCDFIKWQLEEDLSGRGIVINREVQIHRGERTDIHLNAVVRGQPQEGYDSLTLIIEAKGSWHPELGTAMETQLLGQYLQNNPCMHGLYLVGWFNSDKWDDGDYRKKQVPKLTLEEAQIKFEAQALELSKQGKLIKAFVINASIGQSTSN